MDIHKTSKHTPSVWGNLVMASSLGIHMVLCVAAGVGIGYLLDKWLHTRPVLLIVFFVFGVFAGFRQVFKEVRNYGKLNS